MVTRFAPSPTGFLHLGHAYSALMCQKIAGEGELLLRYEDIDHTRTRTHYYGAILEDLAWIGITFSRKPVKQSDRMPLYHAALDLLKANDFTYPCYCTRRELQAGIQAPQLGDGSTALTPACPCRALSETERQKKEEAAVPHCWRLDAHRAAAAFPALTFSDAKLGSVLVKPNLLGDVILARKDIQTSYHIAVVVDDAAQGVTDITRGVDLLESTHIHRVLQEILGYAVPSYHHHDLILDEEGQRLAKRHDSKALRSYRAQGVSAHELLTNHLPPLEKH